MATKTAPMKKQAPKAGQRRAHGGALPKAEAEREPKRAHQPVRPAQAVPSQAAAPATHDEPADEDAVIVAAVPAPGWTAEVEPPEGFEAEIAAEEEEDDEEDDEASDDDAPTSELGRYFRDMAKLPVLRPQEEFERARRLEELEIATWEAILCHLPVIERALERCEKTLETAAPEFARLKKLAASSAKLTPARRKEIEQAIRRAAEQLRRLDLDKRALVLVLRDLEASALYGPPAAGKDRLAAHYRAVKQARRRAEREKGEFVKANLRLVISVARRFAHFGQLPFADLIQEGNLGLMTAVDRFDHRRGYRFSTYATWWIRHAIARAIADRGRTVRLPVHVLDSQQRVARWKRVLTNRLGRQPTDEELSAASGIAKKKLQALGSVPAGRTLSLDAPVAGDDDDDRRLLDLVRDPEADEHAVADRLSDQAMLAEMRTQLSRLKPVEADILRQRFGLEGDEERTLKEIGEKYNLSRERIRQLQEQALAKMRKAFHSKGLA